MNILKNKQVLITGLVSRYSLAFGIAKAMQREGAKILFSYQHERFKTRILKLIQEEFKDALCFLCDVTQDTHIVSLFAQIKQQIKKIDILVHSVAFAPQTQLQGDYIDNTTREGFCMAHDVSSYSFTALAKAARPMMDRGGSLLTLTHLGSQRVLQHYNIMGVAKASLEANVRYMANSLGPYGIRVNAISAGPLRTVAASSIQGLSSMLDLYEKRSPLRQSTTLEQIGNAAVCLCSDLMSGVTGEILYVDNGFNTTMISI